MGNIWSEKLRIELYKWSNADFPQECALIYTSLADESRYSLFRLSVKPEKVLLRLADFLCDDHPVRLHMEIIAERDVRGYFKFTVMRVAANGISQAETAPLRNAVGFVYNCVRRSCSYVVQREGPYNWEVFHVYTVSTRSTTRYYVDIRFDKVNGLSAKFRGPFKFSGIFRNLFLSEPSEEDSESLVKNEVNGEPPNEIHKMVESVFTGTRYKLFEPQGKGDCSSIHVFGQGESINLNNTGEFYGNGNGSKYENCKITMKYKAGKGTN